MRESELLVQLPWASCLFVAIASHLTDDKSAIARMLAAIATGLGFIGAGLKFYDKSNSLMGLTTSSALWATAAVGSAVASPHVCTHYIFYRFNFTYLLVS